MNRWHSWWHVLTLAGLVVASIDAFAAQGEMGTGIPHFGSYSAATNVQLNVWSLADATIPFPAGCTVITLTPATMGMDAYKIAVATMLIANTSNRRVRFYAHAPRDGDAARTTSRCLDESIFGYLGSSQIVIPQRVRYVV